MTDHASYVSPLASLLAGAFLSVSAVATDASQAQDSQQKPQEESKGEFRAQAWTGIGYDSNVAVLDLDQTSGESDYFGLFEGTAGYKRKFAGNIEADISYNFYQSLQFDFSDFNIRTHRPTLDVSRKFDRGRAGASYFYVDAALAGANFLIMNQGSIYGEHMIGRKGYVRASYAYTDKTFQDSPERDAGTQSVSLMGFHFFNAAKTVASATYKYARESARTSPFSYHGHRLQLKVTHKVPVWKRELKLEAQTAWEKRDYTGITEMIDGVNDAERQDDRLNFGAAAELKITTNASIRIEYEHNIFDSNLPAADFAENLVIFKIGYRY